MDPAPPVGPPVADAIRLRGVSKLYGAHHALREVTLSVPPSSVCGLIGPNGAGKSTLMAIVATLLRPSAGSIEVFGVPIEEVARVRPLIGFVPDVLGTYTGLTVQEYLHFYAEAYRIPAHGRDAVVDALLDLVDLDGKRDADLSSLSRGMKQRIALARGLVHDPRLLILDEPASGLDPRARVQLRDIIARLRQRGVTVLISSHILAELEEMCTHAIVLEQGVVVGFETLVGDPARTVVVSFLGQPAEEHRVTSDAEQAELVRSLVAAGRPVLGVTERGSRLEDRFLRLTDGRTN